MKKFFIIFFSVLFTATLIFFIVWGCINFSKVKKGISGSGIYNKEDINNAFEDGYKEALKNKEEYEALINGYRDQITNLTDQVSFLTSEMSSLSNTNNDLNKKIESLNSQVLSLTDNVTNLNEIKLTNQKTITSLNSQLISLQIEIDNLTSSGENKTEEIVKLTNQVENLQSIIAGLENTSVSNLKTINNLNSQIVALNESISSMLSQFESNNNTIKTLNGRINQLEDSVEYYKQLLQAYEKSGKVIATFKVDNKVYNVQVVENGTSVNVVSPLSTPYLIFNGWTIDGNNIINLNDYVLTDNITFTALLTYKYDVKFNYENTEYDSQIIEKGQSPKMITPTNTDYKEFIGWSLDGNTIIDVANYVVNQNTIFYAVFNYSYDVKFVVDNEVFETKIVKSGNFTTAKIPTKIGYIFEGWTLDGENIIDLNTKNITSETIFIAKFRAAITVKFLVDNNEFDTKYIDNNSYVVQDKTPIKDDYGFIGWTLDGTNIINLEDYKIDSDITFIALFSKLLNVTFLLDEEVVNEQKVVTNGFVETPAEPYKEGYIF